MMQSSTAASIITADDRDGALKQVLARFAADTSCLLAEKQDAFEGHANLLHSLLREIDETILPRQLTLYFDQQLVAELTVSHRRLLSFNLTATPASASDRSSVAQTYAQQMRQLVASYNGAGFRITRQPCDIGIESESCSAKLLVDTLAAQQDQSQLQGFLSLAAPSALAWMVQDNNAETTDCSGPEDLIQRLTGLANSSAAARQKRSATLRVPDQTATCMVLTMSPEVRVVLAVHQSEVLLIALPTRNLDTALHEWRSIFFQN